MKAKIISKIKLNKFKVTVLKIYGNKIDKDFIIYAYNKRVAALKVFFKLAPPNKRSFAFLHQNKYNEDILKMFMNSGVGNYITFIVKKID